MLTEKEKLDKLTMLGVELNQVKDMDILMERVLYDARGFVNADAGSIYIRKGDSLDFTYTQNDTQQSRLPEGEKLIYSTFSIPINEKSIAGYVASTGRLLNLPDVYKIEPTAPYSFSKQFDQTSGYTTRSVFTVPLKTARGDILGILQIINAQDESKQVIPFSADDEKMMLHFASIAAVALERAQMTRAILLRMISMAELRDPKETGAHVNRVGGYAVELYEQWARKQQHAPKEIDRARDSLRMAAMLHDVGKVAISDLILKKPGRFSDDEFEVMKQHTVLGARLFLDQQSDFDEAASQVALTHHERWDGKGYPGYVDVATGAPLKEHTLPGGSAGGKKGEEIPIFGRIVALADVFDALSSARVYKEAWSEADVLKIIEKEAGHQFDPEIVEIFFSNLNVLRSIQERYKG
ncbi:MAG: HD-GYP domain-containing protein [Proteobacteria bacterium]|nr:HD-GYP domain-containing protein [Pseudomonadota bacterium]